MRGLTFREERVSSVGVGQKTGGVVTAVHRNVAGTFIQDVHPLSIGVHCQMPRVATLGRY